MPTTFTHNNSIKTRRTRQQWQTIIEDFEQSGLGIQDYCQQNNVAYSSLAKWRSLLKHQKDDGQPHAISFIELPETSTRLTESGWRIELDLGCGVILRLRRE